MTATLANHQVRLAKRPETTATREHWNFTTEPVGEPDQGGVLVQTLSLSLDPAMRGWLNDAKSYIPPVAIGEVMRAGGVGRVIASKNPAFAVGDTVYGTLGVQEYALIPQEALKRVGLVKIDLRLGTVGQWLNVLGMPGMTGYFGLLDIGQPQPGQTVVVSAAAGAVGQTVGQLAKIKGCRAVGIAGGPAKCDWVVKELGFDACIDYKAGPGAVREGLKQHCPNGVDVYFDNVGGQIFDTLLAQMNLFSRVVVCGLISDYNSSDPYRVRNWRAILVNRLRVQGMIVFDWKERYGEALDALAGYFGQGRLKYRESVVEGLENAPRGLIALLKGENFGKQLVKLA